MRPYSGASIPGLLLLDEPVAFQDPAHQALVARWLSASLPSDQAIVTSAHDVNWIAGTRDQRLHFAGTDHAAHRQEAHPARGQEALLHDLVEVGQQLGV